MQEQIALFEKSAGPGPHPRRACRAVGRRLRDRRGVDHFTDAVVKNPIACEPQVLRNYFSRKWGQTVNLMCASACGDWGADYAAAAMFLHVAGVFVAEFSPIR